MFRFILFLSILLGTTSCTSAQSLSDKLKVDQYSQHKDAPNSEGYLITNGQVQFIFDTRAYNVHPEKVTVTGSFRDWDQELDNPDWQLNKNGEIFLLTLSAEQSKLLTPNSQFKFRIDDGIWLDPPVEASNIKAGNLVFEPSAITKSLKAEIIDNNTIIATIVGDRPLDKAAYKLTDADGIEIPIATVLPRDSEETIIIPETSIDRRKVYFLSIPSLELQSWCSYDGWMKTLYSSKELGANIKNGITSIRLFAPRAEQVKLYLYQNAKDSIANETIEMTSDEQGVWEVIIAEDLHGVYYDFTIHGGDQPGNMFYNTHPVHLTDPYARVSDNTWGKGRIWKATVPAAPLKNGIPPMQDVIAYEVHVQDFTDNLPIPNEKKGTFDGMITPGLKNKAGHSIGLDYLLDLGINTVHLMPVQEYLHWPDEDWKASFKDDPYMIEQGVSGENYQWGYRTSHFMAIESKYRVKGQEPGTERDQFRNLVQTFHDNGIAVIIDIVPNHTAENMDGNGWIFNFNGIDKMYYYRTKDFEHIGAYGNEVKTENRPMVQRWLIDQCLHFINEFGIDGFRIDLAGQIDQQTLIKLKDAIGHDKILYGEAWIGSNDPNFENNPDWDWYKEDAPITFFQDDTRNAFKGSVFTLEDPKKDRGWTGGAFDQREAVMNGLINHQPEDKTPLSGINYLDIHDNFALADQFGKNFDGRLEVDQDLYKIATTLLYTSLGPIVTHGGSEIMRSKAHAPLREVEKTTNGGFKTFMHGYRDTYNHRTANQFKWKQVGAKPLDENQNNYNEMYHFWKGLNAFRLSNYGRVFRQSERVSDDYYKWITPPTESVLGYTVNNQVLVLLNVGDTLYDLDSRHLPKGRWKLIGNNEKIDHVNGVVEVGQPIILDPSTVLNSPLQPKSVQIWVQE